MTQWMRGDQLSEKTAEFIAHVGLKNPTKQKIYQCMHASMIIYLNSDLGRNITIRQSNNNNNKTTT